MSKLFKDTDPLVRRQATRSSDRNPERDEVSKAQRRINIALSQSRDVPGANDCSEARKKALCSSRRVLYLTKVYSRAAASASSKPVQRDIPANCSIAHTELTLYPFCVSPSLSRQAARGRTRDAANVAFAARLGYQFVGLGMRYQGARS